MATELTLRDGTPAMIWALSPSDTRGLQERYRHLSAPARYSRFLSSVQELSGDMLHRLVDNVDGREHIALVLVAFPDDGLEGPVGIGRLVRSVERPTAADVAVTVDDDWRGRGIATALLAELVELRPPGVHEIITQVAADNHPSFAMLRRLGQMTTVPDGMDVYEVHVDLDTPAQSGGVRATGDEPSASGG